MLNRNRCILCTRCVRFMKDVDGDEQIGIVNRGYGSEIATSREEGVRSLLSGNLMDVCPVGAITTRDYRFKSRPWDNPNAVDTICPLCERGCNTTVWIKAKPEWAKGSQLVRITPRFNPDVNGYWMCDIGRFEYHWVESPARLSRPLARQGDVQEPVAWEDALTRIAERIGGGRAGTRFLLSAHASHEEMFTLARLAQELLGDVAQDAIDVSWTSSAKVQPANTQFKVPEVDAPNLAGARAFGLSPAEAGRPDLARLRDALASGTVNALYVLDPGPSGSVGDVRWLVEARRSGSLPLLIVQAAVVSELSQSADIVLPGCAWLEKDGAFTNREGRLQAAPQAVLPPGEARDDTRILLDVAQACGITLAHTSSATARQAIAELLPKEPALAGIAELAFARPAAARHWLQASNPMERLKWDAMFFDAPPFKFADVHQPSERAGIIRLMEVK
jgi:NADH-quinone oxidoreductase subunit G